MRDLAVRNFDSEDSDDEPPEENPELPDPDPDDNDADEEAEVFTGGTKIRILKDPENNNEPTFRLLTRSKKLKKSRIWEYRESGLITMNQVIFYLPGTAISGQPHSIWMV